jgi:hypothetical protein
MEKKLFGFFLYSEPIHRLRVWAKDGAYCAAWIKTSLNQIKTKNKPPFLLIRLLIRI